MTTRIYLDNAATTMVDPNVVETMLPYYTEKYGNPSSIHSMGVEAKKAMAGARKLIADSINANPCEIIFTSGGTESNNIALKSIAFTNKDKGNHIITTKIEHKCILNACKWLEEQGFKVTYLDVDKDGYVNPVDIEKAITSQTILVSIIHGHNEIGTIQDLESIGKICSKHDVYFHTDACQSYTKTLLDVKKQNLSLVTLNAHKIHGPKGIGALYIRKGTKIKAWQHGGDQEFKLRTGTENIPSIIGFAKCVEIASPEHIKHMDKLKDKLIDRLLKIPHVSLNGPKERLCNNINLFFEAIEGEALIEYLDIEGISCSTGSACSSKSLDPSYVLIAIGMDAGAANSSIRLSISRFTTEVEIDKVLEIVPKVVDKLRKMSPFKIGEIAVWPY